MSNPHVITLVDTAGNVALATADDVVEDIVLDGQSLMQPQQALRAATTRPLNRGNRQRTLSFRVKKKAVASPAAALKAVFDLEKLLQARLGPTVTLQFAGTGGFTITFTHAVLAHRGRAPGTVSHHDYTLTAGDYTVA